MKIGFITMVRNISNDLDQDHKNISYLNVYRPLKIEYNTNDYIELH